MKLLLNKKGFTNITLALMLIVIPTAVLVGIRFYEAMQKGAQLQKSTTTKSQLNNIKNWLMASSSDPDSDNQPELVKENGGNTLPLALPMKTSDDYGVVFKYYTWDLAAANGNATYSQNNVAPPIAGLVGRVISAGRDGVFQTNNTSTVSQGDDIMVDIFATDVVNNKNNSGWAEDILNNKVTLLNDTRNVGIGTQTPGSKLDVAGNTNISSNITVGGTGTVVGNFTAPNVVSGINANKTSSITDPNQALPSGFYNINGGTNLPWSSWWYMTVVRHENIANNYQLQTINDFFSAASYTRTVQNGVYGSWTATGGATGYNGWLLNVNGIAGNFVATGRLNGNLFSGELKAWDTTQAISGTKWCGADPNCVFVWGMGDLMGYNNVNGYSYAVTVINLPTYSQVQIF